ncbi:MAG: NAD(P)H-binding protein, partial [Actinobacteria bacterium]|nr:NAD(P)H-binding protein [Actinomycetota bacterium]MCG2808334.1 NAD(P)H-binding protein [Coriobacteriia bacterium]
MRIVVIGATGRTGRAVVEQALGHGDEVVAFARQPERLELSHPRLTLAPGDVRELDSLRAALVGAEGVV